MTQQINQQTQLLQGFNYADPTTGGDYLQKLVLEEGKPVLVSFLENVPGMQSPPIVFCKVHWNSEMGDKGRRYQCFGGLCCEQVTWQKGFGGQPGKFSPNKAQTRYYVPLVVYEPDPANQTQMRATVKYMDMTWTAFTSLSSAIQNTNEGLSFWERDILVSVKKVNGATDYIFDRRESKSQWLSNPVFTQQVNEQLQKTAEKLLASLPQAMTESEFLEMKTELDAKVQAAMNSHSGVQQPTTQSQFGSLPQGVGIATQPMQQAFTPAQQTFTQPQVNIPIQSVQVEQPKVEEPVQSVQVEQPAQEIPQISLDFDPSQLLK